MTRDPRAYLHGPLPRSDVPRGPPERPLHRVAQLERVHAHLRQSGFWDTVEDNWENRVLEEVQSYLYHVVQQRRGSRERKRRREEQDVAELRRIVSIQAELICSEATWMNSSK